MVKKKTRRKATSKAVPEIGKRYAWRPASRFTKLNPQVIGQELERVRQAHGVHMTAENVVDAASDPMNPLHDAFPWDDLEAAHQHRLDVARRLMRSVQVVIITPEQKEVVVSAFVSTPRDLSHNARHYTTTEVAMHDPELRGHVLRQALQELAAFRRKYAELSELAIVFAAIDTQTKTKKKTA